MKRGVVYLVLLIIIQDFTILDKYINHKNYNFLACDWFQKVLFSTNSLAKLLSDSLLSDSLLSFNKPIKFKVAVYINQ